MKTSERLSKLENKVKILEDCSFIIKSSHGFVANSFTGHVKEKEILFYKPIKKESKELVDDYYIFEYNGKERLEQIKDCHECFSFYIDNKLVSFVFVRDF